jgi:hypothetical protein
MEFIVDFVRTHLNHQSIYPNTVLFVKEELYPLLAVRIMKIIYENGKDSVNRLFALHASVIANLTDCLHALTTAGCD